MWQLYWGVSGGVYYKWIKNKIHCAAKHPSPHFILIPHPLSMNIGYEEFHCNHVYAGVLTVIQLMVVITFQLEVMDSEHLPAKRICKQILDVICDHNLAPLIGKHHNTGNNIQEFVNKRKCIEYDHERSEFSVMNDWVRDVRCFATSSLRGHSE